MPKSAVRQTAKAKQQEEEQKRQGQEAQKKYTPKSDLSKTRVNGAQVLAEEAQKKKSLKGRIETAKEILTGGKDTKSVGVNNGGGTFLGEKPATTQKKFTEEANEKPTNGERKSNNEYQKQKQKQKTFSEEANEKKPTITQMAGKNGEKPKPASPDKESAKQLEPDELEEPNYKPDDGDVEWADKQETKAGGKDTHKENAKKLDNEIDRLLTEKATSEGLTVEEADEYDRQIKALREQAKEEHKAAGDKTLGEKWEDLKYDPNNWTGENEWAFLDRDQQTDNLAGGWGRQYAGGAAMSAGTGLQWFDQASDDMVRYEYDQEHGEGAYDRAIAGKNVNQIGQLGNKLWDTGTGLQQTGEEMWAEGTENMSDTGKQIANVAKTGMDVVGDIALNAVTPGMGTMRMYLGAAGNAAYEQSQRENNDIDSRAVAALKGGLNAYLSNKLVGGLDAAYGESVLGKYVHGGFEGLSPEVQKTLKPFLNTEGVEEALENILNYAADEILGLDSGKPLDWNEVMQDYAVGYALGVLTNGLAGGMTIDNKKQQNIGREMVEFGERAANEGLTIDQAAEEGKASTRDQVAVKYEPEAEPAVAENVPAETNTDAQATVKQMLDEAAGGENLLTPEQAMQVLDNPEMFQAYQEQLDYTPEEAREMLNETAGIHTGQETQTGAEPHQNPGSINQDTSTTGSGPEKTSEFYSNTLLKEEGPERVPEPLTYLTKSDAETLQNAMNRLNLNGKAETETMMAATLWSDEQFKMAKAIRASLGAEADMTGNRAAYDAWILIEREHATAAARALRAVGSRSGSLDNSEEIRQMANRYLDMIQEGMVDTVGDVNEQTIADTKAEMEKATTEIGKLEAEEAQYVNDGMSEEEAFDKVKDRYLNLAQELVAKRNVGMLADNVLGKNRALRKGAQDVNTKLKRILARQDADYIKRFVRANDAGIITDLKYKGKPTAAGTAKWVSSMQKMCQLFGTGTTLRNLEGNAAFGTLDFLSNDVAGVATDTLLSLLTGNRTRGIETGIVSGKNLKAAKTAMERSALEVAANMDMSEDGKYIGTGTSAFNPYNVGSRFLNRANQILSYALNTTDAAFIGLSQESAGNAAQRANKRRGGNMTEETAKEIGKNEAEYRTYKNDTLVQTKLEDFRNMLDLVGWGGELTKNAKGKVNGRQNGFGLGTALVPYIGVPVNIALKGAEYSPIGALVGAVNAGKAVNMANNADANSQAAQDALILQNKASGQIGRGITGTALVWLLAGLMKQAKEDDKEWFKDWNLEENADVKAQNKAEGKSGLQINVDRLRKLINGEDFSGKWQNDENTVNIAALEPLDQYLSLASLLADDDDALDVWGYLGALASSTGESLEDLPAISSLSQISDTINYNTVYDTKMEEDDEGNLVETREVNKGKTALSAAASMAGNAASGFIPAPIRHAAQVTDEYQRETKGDTAAQTALNQILNSTPWTRGKLDIKTDNYGNPVTQGDLGTRLANTYLANKYTEVNQSDVSREMERLRDETGKVYTPPRTGPSSITIGTGKDKKTVYLTNDERKEYGNEYGKAVEKSMQDLMQDPVYNQEDPDTQGAIVKEIEAFDRDTMKTDMAKEKNIPFESKYEDVRGMKDPVEVLTMKTAYNDAKKNEDWNAVETLLDSVRDNKGKWTINQDTADYLIGKDSKINYYTYLGDKGIPIQRAKDFESELKTLYEGEKRESARASDMIRVAGNGNYTPEEADAIMSYEHEVSKESIERYQNQVQYQLEQAGLGSKYDEVWKRLQMVADGEQDKDVFRKWIRNEAKDPKNRSGIPAKQGEEILNVMSNYASDNHVAGVYVTAFYNAARSIGCSPKQALQFFDHIDTNYNGSYSKSEIDKAVAWAFGYDSKYKKKYYGNTYIYYNFSGQAKKVRDSIKKATGR